MRSGPREMVNIETCFPMAGIAGLAAELQAAVRAANEEATDAIARMKRIRAAGNVKRARRALATLESIEPSCELWSLSDLERGARLSTIAEHWAIAGTNIQEHRENLWALAQFVRGTTMKEVQRTSARFPTDLRQRLLVRFLWMTADAEAILSGRSVARPFACTVPSRLHRDPHGEEFWSLLTFLPAYHAATGKILVPLSKEERPDFRLWSETEGREVGLEHTEAVVAATNKSRADSERWQDLLRQELPTVGCWLHFKGSPAFPRLRSKQRAAFVEFVRAAVASAGEIGDDHEHQFLLDGGEIIRFEVDLAEKGQGLRFMYMDRPDGWAGDSPERLVAESIVRAATHKLLHKQPEGGLGTILLIYPNDSAPVRDWSIPVRLATPDVAKVPAGFFEEVWVARDRAAWQVKAN